MVSTPFCPLRRPRCTRRHRRRRCRYFCRCCCRCCCWLFSNAPFVSIGRRRHRRHPNCGAPSLSSQRGGERREEGGTLKDMQQMSSSQYRHQRVDSISPLSHLSGILPWFQWRESLFLLVAVFFSYPIFLNSFSDSWNLFGWHRLSVLLGGSSKILHVCLIVPLSLPLSPPLSLSLSLSWWYCISLSTFWQLWIHL